MTEHDEVRILCCTYLRADEVSDHLLSAADGLVPATFLALRIILGDGSAARGGVACESAAGLRGVVLDLGLVLLGLTLLLVGRAASEVAEKGLGSARGRVNVGLEGRGVLVRHSDVGVVRLRYVVFFVKSEKLSLFPNFVDCELIVVGIEHGEERSKGLLCLKSRVAQRQSKEREPLSDGGIYYDVIFVHPSASTERQNRATQAVHQPCSPTRGAYVRHRENYMELMSFRSWKQAWV